MIHLMFAPIMFCLTFHLIIYIQIFAVHAIGGLIGNILTGIFAQASVAGFDGRTSILGGWLDRHWAQIGFQLANSAVAMAYSGLVTVRTYVSYATVLTNLLIRWLFCGPCTDFLVATSASAVARPLTKREWIMLKWARLPTTTARLTTT